MSGMIATITDYVSERVADGKDALVNFKDAPVESLTCLIPLAIKIIAIITGIVSYIAYLVTGGYTEQIARISEYGFMNDSIFSVGTAGWITGGIIGDFIGILVLIEFGIVFFQCFENNEKMIKVLLCVSGICFVLEIMAAFITFWIACGRIVISHQAISEMISYFGEWIMKIKAVGIVYNIILIASVLIMSILLLLTEECRENMKQTVVALILAKVLVPATIWALENIIAVVAVLLGIAMFTGFFLLLGRGLLEGGKNISDGENSASDIKKVDTAIVSAKRQEKKESLRKKENTVHKDNRSPREKDDNPNHHYIANYQEFGGIRLYKVHNKAGDYIELDNYIVSVKKCSLADAEKGKCKFYRSESGKEIRLEEIPWKKNSMRRK